MTLRTHIVVVDPVPAKDLYEHCLVRLLGAPADVKFTDERRGNARRSFVTEPDQGLAAWLIVDYAVDGPLLPYPDDDPTPPFLEHGADVNFDTGYGYQEHGATAGDLHAWLISELGAWLDEHGARWFWQDEFSGTWYPQTASPDGVLGDVAAGAPR